MNELSRPHKLLKYLPFCICKFVANRKHGRTIVLNTFGSFAEYKYVYLGDGVYFLFNKQKAYRAKLSRLEDKMASLQRKLQDSEKMKIDEKNIIKFN